MRTHGSRREFRTFAIADRSCRRPAHRPWCRASLSSPWSFRRRSVRAGRGGGVVTSDALLEGLGYRTHRSWRSRARSWAWASSIPGRRRLRRPGTIGGVFQHELLETGLVFDDLHHLGEGHEPHAGHLAFARRHTDLPIKVTLPGPYLLTRAMFVPELTARVLRAEERDDVCCERLFVRVVPCRRRTRRSYRAAARRRSRYRSRGSPAGAADPLPPRRRCDPVPRGRSDGGDSRALPRRPLAGAASCRRS
jgi:hypothetical protein